MKNIDFHEWGHYSRGQVIKKLTTCWLSSIQIWTDVFRLSLSSYSLCMYEKVTIMTMSIEETVSLDQGERSPDSYFPNRYGLYAHHA